MQETELRSEELKWTKVNDAFLCKVFLRGIYRKHDWLKGHRVGEGTWSEGKAKVRVRN